ncbi:calcium-binding protein E63-1 isoform X2 [Photinus pyralis]|uniref:calcium-binding protein E63-1 isoform X2 n=1 Tax=Photinus pyralis TaxID=7054 RepID=UPI001266F539|nr:calcium-binding protein E63-1 isoform X2 [Photinus pyralis]
MSVGRREFTEDELKELRIAFDLLDRNRDGRVTPSELQFMLGKLGIPLKDEMVLRLLRSASPSGNELLNESEFVTWVKKIQSLLPEEVEDDTSKDLIAAFRVFDVERRGYVTKNELRAAMEMIGEPVTETQLNDFIRSATTDKDGRVNYEEFARQFT